MFPQLIIFKCKEVKSVNNKVILVTKACYCSRIDLNKMYSICKIYENRSSIMITTTQSSKLIFNGLKNHMPKVCDYINVAVNRKLCNKTSDNFNRIIKAALKIFFKNFKEINKQINGE